MLQRYRDLQDIIAILGVDELVRRGQADRRVGPAACSVSWPSPCLWRRPSPARTASSRRSRIQSASFKMILEGEMDQYPEQAFYMVGGADDVMRKAKEIETA